MYLFTSLFSHLHDLLSTIKIVNCPATWLELVWLRHFDYIRIFFRVCILTFFQSKCVLDIVNFPKIIKTMSIFWSFIFQNPVCIFWQKLISNAISFNFQSCYLTRFYENSETVYNRYFVYYVVSCELLTISMH